MNDTAVRQLDMGRRVRDFTNSLAALFTTGSRARLLVDRANEAVALLETESAKQLNAARSEQDATDRKDELLRQLLEQMSAVNLTARGMNKLYPGITALFRMPRGSGIQNCINTARSFITEATPRAADFTGRGLPANFLTTMEATIAQLLAVIDEQDEARRRQTTATAAIKAAQRQLLDSTHELNPIIRNMFGTDPATLAAWDSARRVERAPKKAAKKKTP